MRGATTARWPSARQADTVDVAGYPVRVKVSPGRVKVEHDDAARVARRAGLPLREVLLCGERDTQPIAGFDLGYVKQHAVHQAARLNQELAARAFQP